jgi:hypothetical protein
LFIHELHSIAECWQLILHGIKLESSLSLGEGQFTVVVHNKEKNFWMNVIIGPEGAAFAIYTMMMSAWLYLVAFGLWSVVDKCCLLSVGALWIVMIPIGFWLCCRNIKKQMDASKADNTDTARTFNRQKDPRPRPS